MPRVPDEDWLRLGIRRVLEQVGSSRAFLPEHGPSFRYQPTRANYFEALASERRRDLASAVNRRPA